MMPYNKRKFSKGNKGDGLTITKKDFTGGVPDKEKVSAGSEHFDYVAFRDLSFKGAIEPKADPNTEAAKGSYPYAILNKTNRVLEAHYPGYDNLTGNSVVRLQNSVSSQFLNFIDSIVAVKRINYLYLGYESGAKNAPFNYEMVKALEQALSYGYSTMLTQLPFYTDACVTDLPRNTGSAFENVHNDTYDKMGALLHYQIILQNAVSPLAKYVEVLSLEDELMDMSYRREAPLIQQIFGQLKKKAFIALLNSVGTSVLGEYFDYDWWTQMNSLRHLPSREANDMNHPLLTMVTTHYTPRLRLWGIPNPNIDESDPGYDTPYYDSNTDLAITVAANTLLDPENFLKSSKTTWSMEELLINLNKLLDAHYILTWCRKLTSGILPVGAIHEASAYYKGITDYLNLISQIMSKFGAKMTEIRTFLDKMNDTAMVYWKKGMKFDISKVYPKSLTYNQIIADVIKTSLSGARELIFNATTQRWTCNTEWNIYTGVNKFDKYSGGSFLTFSLREISGTDSGGNTIDINSATFILPVIFAQTPVIQPETGSWAVALGHTAAGIKAVNRLGLDVYFDTYAITNANINSDAMLSRLNPLSDATLSIKAPNINVNHFNAVYPSISSDETAHVLSAIHKVLLQVAKYDRVVNPKDSSVLSACDPDLLAIIDLQVEDVSNAMIQFARNYSPFRVNTLDGKRTMGFGKSENNIAG